MMDNISKLQKLTTEQLLLLDDLTTMAVGYEDETKTQFIIMGSNSPWGKIKIKSKGGWAD